jgi:TetR/AcrR family transcriptional repressor of nem operon
MLSIGSEVSTQDQGVRATVERIWDRKIKYFETAIRDAHAQGLIVAPDPQAKARALFACYHGTLAQARIENDVELIRDFKEVARDVLGVKHEHAVSS